MSEGSLHRSQSRFSQSLWMQPVPRLSWLSWAFVCSDAYKDILRMANTYATLQRYFPQIYKLGHREIEHIVLYTVIAAGHWLLPRFCSTMR